MHPHLEATVSVAEAVNPKTSGNWEGTGVTPDLQTPAAQARDTAYRRALQDVAARAQRWRLRLLCPCAASLEGPKPKAQSPKGPRA